MMDEAMDLMPALETIVQEGEKGRVGTRANPLDANHPILQEPTKMEKGRSYWILMPDGSKMKVKRVGKRIVTDT